jgi:transcriptional regulator with XRE-family HTH domain
MKATRSRLAKRFGAVIRRHREAQKWTQDDFARHIKMHRAQYGTFERGGANDVQFSTLERIAAGLGEAVWVLVREVEETKSVRPKRRSDEN